MINSEYVKDGAVVLDVGINRDEIISFVEMLILRMLKIRFMQLLLFQEELVL